MNWTDNLNFKKIFKNLKGFKYIQFIQIVYFLRGFSDGSVVKNPAASAGDARNTGSIPGSGRSLGREDPETRKWKTTPVFLSGKISWTEQPGGLQPIGIAKSQAWLTTTTTSFSASPPFSYSYLLKALLGGLLVGEDFWYKLEE